MKLLKSLIGDLLKLKLQEAITVASVTASVATVAVKAPEYIAQYRAQQVAQQTQQQVSKPQAESVNRAPAGINLEVAPTPVINTTSVVPSVPVSAQGLVDTNKSAPVSISSGSSAFASLGGFVASARSSVGSLFAPPASSPFNAYQKDTSPTPAPTNSVSSNDNITSIGNRGSVEATVDAATTTTTKTNAQTASASGSVPLTLQFTAIPTNPSAGTAWATAPALILKDSAGNQYNTGTYSITLAAYSDSTCSTSPTSPLIGTTSQALTNGVVSFAGLSVAKKQSLYLKASSASANIATACSAIINVQDTTAPSVSLTTAPAGSYKGGASFTLGFSASDNESDVSITVQYAADGATFATVATLTGTATSYSWTIPSDNTALAKIKVIATDQGNNAVAATSAAFTIDSTPPAAPGVTLASSALTSNSTVSLTITSCVDRPYLYINESTQPSDTATGWVACNTNAGGVTYVVTGDGAHTVKVWAKDSVGNVSATAGSVSMTLDTTNPTLALTSYTGGQSAKGGAANNITWTASDANFGATPIKLEYSNDSGATWNTIVAATANTSPYAWTPAAVNVSTYRLRITATDAVGNVTQVTSTSDFIVDSSVPTITAAQMSINGGAASTYNPNVQVSLQATDNISNITKFCLQYNTTTAPTASSTCWVAVNQTPQPNLALSPNLNLVNFNYALGIAPTVYNVYAWVMDAAGNISALSNTGAGTIGQDKATITYNLATPPALSYLLATATDAPSAPPSSGDLTVPAGQSVFIKWKATDAQGFGATPIALYYTTDDTNYTLIANNLTNGQNGGCSVNNAGTTADDNDTGCYLWAGGSPANTYFKIRVQATNSLGMVTYANTVAINTATIFNFLAGNTEQGIGSSASAAVFFNYTNASYPDIGSFVVTSTGRLYIRDIYAGILYVDPSDGVLKKLVGFNSAGSNTYEGALSGANLKMPYRITLDENDNLLVFDYDRIRKIDPNTNTISTIIGGGANTGDTVSPPTSLQITAPGSLGNWQGTAPSNYMFNAAGMAFFVLPNGDIYFQSQNYVGAATGAAGGYQIRVLTKSTNTVTSIYPSGTGDSMFNAQALNVCPMGLFGVVYDPVTSAISHIQTVVSHYALTAAFSSCSSGSYGGSVNLNTVNYTSQAPYDANSISFPFQGLTKQGADGNLYRVSRTSGQIKKYNVAGNTWTTVVGTGTVGSCADGTVATSCKIDPVDAYVTAQGRIYFNDRERIRVVDDAGKVQTVYGQALTYGDGGPALSARFNLFNYIDLWNNGTNDKIVLLDWNEALFREFDVAGNIQTIAGNGAIGNSSTGVAATATGVMTTSSGAVFARFGTNATTGDIYFGRSRNNVSKLNRATGQWVDIVAGTAGTNYTLADGFLGNTISFSVGTQYGGVMGFDGTNVLYNIETYGTPYIDTMWKLYSIANGTQSHLAGVTGNAGSTYCANGVAGSACAVPQHAFSGVPIALYDSFGGTWLFASGASIVSIVPGGNKTTPITLPRTPTALAYRHDAGNNMMYYCSGGVMYKYNVNTSTETTLTWPIASMTCSGKNMIYSSTRNSVIFSYKQNNLMGIAEYLNP